MKRILSILFLFLFSIIGIKSNAAVSSYPFSQSMGAYSEIIGGTIVAEATATSGAGSLDDVNYPTQPIPFTFTFNGIGYTEFNINSNGYITFGTTLPAPGSPYTPISNTAGYSGAIAGVGRDIQGTFGTTADRTSGSDVLTNVANFEGVQVGKFITGTGIPGTTTTPTTTIVSFDTGAGTITMSQNATSTGAAGTIAIASGEIRYEVLGSAPNRILVIQFKNFRKFAAVTDNFNFQIRLYETTNNIDVIYGGFVSNTSNAAPQVGLRGATNADFNNRTTTTDWAATTAGTNNTSNCTLTNTVFPPSGLTFTWSALNDPIFSASPSSFDFGLVKTGSTSANQTITITNTGGGTLTVTSLTKTGTDAGQFNLTDGNTYPVNLLTDESMTVQVNFAPTTNGLKEAQLDVVHNATGSPSTIPLSGTAFTHDPNITIGASNYSTLGYAFIAINNGVHTGDIVVNVNASTTETFSAVLNASGTAPGDGGPSSNYTSVLIKPTAPGVSISGDVAGALINLNGADNVTIDGRVGSTNARELTINNTNTATFSVGVRMTSLGTGLGATFNTIMWCNIMGGTNTVTLNTFGIYIAGTTITATGTGADNDNIIISNNHITKNTFGIYSRGTSTANPNDGMIIQNNIIGDDLADNYITLNGIDMTNSTNVNVSNNKIFNIIASHTVFLRAMNLSAGMSNVTINANEIGNIQNTTTTGFRAGQGIFIGGTGTVNATISNNSIYGLHGHGSTTIVNNMWGIIINAGNGYNIYFNSISLTGAGTPTGSVDRFGCIYLLSASSNGINIVNNILSNTKTPGNAASGFALNVQSATSAANISNINYNDYYGTGSRYFVGTIGGVDRATLADWQTGTSQDANSINGNPLFANANNYLPVSSTSPCLLAGTGSTGITTDILGNLRGSMPTIGAYENPENVSDASVVILYTLGFIPVDFGANHVIRAIVSNTGNTEITNLNVTLDITGANTFSNVKVVASLAVGASATVTFDPFTPVTMGSNTVMVSVPPVPGRPLDNGNISSYYNSKLISSSSSGNTATMDLPVYSLTTPVNTKGLAELDQVYNPDNESETEEDNMGANFFSVPQEVTQNQFSYAIGTTPTGGVGFTGGTGDFVAKFTTAVTGTLNQVDVNFVNGGQPFHVGIWDASGPGGTPGVLLHETPELTSAPGLFTVLISPPVVIPPGDFFVGVRQVGTVNVSFAFQTENPIRSGTFYFASPTGSTTWNDFAPGSPFRFMIAPKFALLNDVGVTAFADPMSGQVIPAGQNRNVIATVTNLGTAPQSNIPVSLMVFDGTSTTTYGPVTTSGTPIITGGSEDVTFSNVVIPGTPGTITFTAYTEMLSDQNRDNDTLTQANSSQTPITSFPYFQDFTDVTGWTNTGTTSIWSILNATNPNGMSGNPGLRANFYGVSSGTGNYRSPLLDLAQVFDLSGLSNPLLTFYVASRTYTDNAPDVLQILVSSNGGATWSAPLYNKSQVGSPPLATLPPDASGYTPGAASEWRQETVNLAAYGGQSNVMISFTGITAFGNNCWVDNVKIADVQNFQSQLVTATGPYNFSGPTDAFSVTVNMTTIGPAPDGNLNFSRSSGAPQFFSADEFAVNAAATTPDGSIFTPDKISPDGYYTLTYDYSSAAVYDISIDVVDYTGINNPDKLYIVKRVDEYSPWVALSTTRVLSVLTASGVTGFSQFGIASDEAINPLPVELTSFTATVDRRDVHLNWTTASEINNSGFDIEKKAEGSEAWSKAGFVEGNGTTTEAKNYSFTDRGLNTGNYSYRLKQIDYNGNFEFFNLSSEVSIGVPDKYDLSQNYPNPFNPTTKINFDLPFDSKVTMKIFDITGREIVTLVNEVHDAGYYTVTFDARNIASGMYFYRIIAEGGSEQYVMTKKMMVIK